MSEKQSSFIAIERNKVICQFAAETDHPVRASTECFSQAPQVETCASAKPGDGVTAVTVGEEAWDGGASCQVISLSVTHGDSKDLNIRKK